MTERSAIHSTFSLERHYGVPPARVFAAWADPAARARRFAGPASEHELDFRSAAWSSRPGGSRAPATSSAPWTASCGAGGRPGGSSAGEVAAASAGEVAAAR
jgi:uncharacterized protein YndB with AHSA1/START domain